ncbi:hypothetical protein ScPMuIL_014808 [Solemya velum]
MVRAFIQRTDNQSVVPLVKKIVKASFAVVLSTVCFHVLAILYGAPVIESSAETFHFALLLSVTTVLPCICVLGQDSYRWSRVFLHNSPSLGAETVVLFTTYGSLVGAWLGAFPIPLDWDRPWQVWPISCVIGNLIGYMAALAVSSVYIYHKYNVSKKFKLT